MPGIIYNGIELQYDSKKGFTLCSVTILNSGSYFCHGALFDQEQDVIFQLDIMCKGILNVFEYINI